MFNTSLILFFLFVPHLEISFIVSSHFFAEFLLSSLCNLRNPDWKEREVCCRYKLRLHCCWCWCSRWQSRELEASAPPGIARQMVQSEAALLVESGGGSASAVCLVLARRSQEGNKAREKQKQVVSATPEQHLPSVSARHDHVQRQASQPEMWVWERKREKRHHWGVKNTKAQVKHFSHFASCCCFRTVKEDRMRGELGGDLRGD